MLTFEYNIMFSLDSALPNNAPNFETWEVLEFLAWGIDFIHKYLILICWQLKFVVSSLINFTHTANIAAV